MSGWTGGAGGADCVDVPVGGQPDRGERGQSRVAAGVLREGALGAGEWVRLCLVEVWRALRSSSLGRSWSCLAIDAVFAVEFRCLCLFMPLDMTRWGRFGNLVQCQSVAGRRRTFLAAERTGHLKAGNRLGSGLHRHRLGDSVEKSFGSCQHCGGYLCFSGRLGLGAHRVFNMQNPAA